MANASDDPTDEELLAQLAEEVDKHDPVPDEVTQAAKDAPKQG